MKRSGGGGRESKEEWGGGSEEWGKEGEEVKRSGKEGVRSWGRRERKLGRVNGERCVQFNLGEEGERW